MIKLRVILQIYQRLHRGSIFPIYIFMILFLYLNLVTMISLGIIQIINLKMKPCE